MVFRIHDSMLLSVFSWDLLQGLTRDEERWWEPCSKCAEAKYKMDRGFNPCRGIPRNADTEIKARRTHAHVHAKVHAHAHAHAHEEGQPQTSTLKCFHVTNSDI